EQDRIETGRTLAVDGEGGHALAEPSREADDAGGGAPGRGVAEDDLVDGAGLKARILQGRQHHRRGEAFGAAAAVRPPPAAGPRERGTPRGNDVGRSQRRGRGHSLRIRTGAAGVLEQRGGAPAAPPAARVSRNRCSTGSWRNPARCRTGRWRGRAPVL